MDGPSIEEMSVVMLSMLGWFRLAPQAGVSRYLLFGTILTKMVTPLTIGAVSEY